MKKIITLLAILLLASCSDDDNSNNKSGSETVMLPQTITAKSEGANPLDVVYEFAYDSKRRIKTVVKTGTSSFAFTYHYNEDDLVEFVDVINGAQNSQAVFEYDSDNHLEKIDFNGNVRTFSYDEQTRIYTLDGENELEVNENGDLIRIDTSVFNYADNPGAFRNVSSSNFKLVNFFIDSIFIYAGGHNTLSGASIDEVSVLEVTATYNEAGFPKALTFDPSDGEELKLTIEYSDFLSNKK